MIQDINRTSKNSTIIFNNSSTKQSDQTSEAVLKMFSNKQQKIFAAKSIIVVPTLDIKFDDGEDDYHPPKPIKQKLKPHVRPFTAKDGPKNTHLQQLVMQTGIKTNGSQEMTSIKSFAAQFKRPSSILDTQATIVQQKPKSIVSENSLSREASNNEQLQIQNSKKSSQIQTMLNNIKKNATCELGATNRKIISSSISTKWYPSLTKSSLTQKQRQKRPNSAINAHKSPQFQNFNSYKLPKQQLTLLQTQILDDFSALKEYSSKANDFFDANIVRISKRAKICLYTDRRSQSGLSRSVEKVKTNLTRSTTPQPEKSTVKNQTSQNRPISAIKYQQDLVQMAQPCMQSLNKRSALVKLSELCNATLDKSRIIKKSELESKSSGFQSILRDLLQLKPSQQLNEQMKAQLLSPHYFSKLLLKRNESQEGQDDDLKKIQQLSIIEAINQKLPQAKLNELSKKLADIVQNQQQWNVPNTITSVYDLVGFKPKGDVKNSLKLIEQSF